MGGDGVCWGRVGWVREGRVRRLELGLVGRGAQPIVVSMREGMMGVGSESVEPSRLCTGLWMGMDMRVGMASVDVVWVWVAGPGCLGLGLVVWRGFLDVVVGAVVGACCLVGRVLDGDGDGRLAPVRPRC